MCWRHNDISLPTEYVVCNSNVMNCCSRDQSHKSNNPSAITLSLSLSVENKPELIQPNRSDRGSNGNKNEK